jgi:membrane-associated phospholipid phosphatase
MATGNHFWLDIVAGAAVAALAAVAVSATRLRAAPAVQA